MNVDDDEDEYEIPNAELSLPTQLEHESFIGEMYPSTSIRVFCVAHKVQLAVNEFLWKDEKTTANIIVKAQMLTGKLRTSICKMQMKIDGVPFAKTDQITRWSSTYNMLERLIEIKPFCDRHKHNKDFQGLNLPDQVWKQFNEIVTALKPATVFTTRVQSENLLSTDFISYWKEMTAEIDKLAQTSFMAKRLNKYIKKREKEIFDSPMILAGWYLNKKLNVLMSVSQAEAAKKIIRMVHEKKMRLTQTDNQANAELEQGAGECEVIEEECDNGALGAIEDEAKLTELDRLLQNYDKGVSTSNEPVSIFSQKRLERAQQTELEKEFVIYDNMPRQRSTINNLEYWDMMLNDQAVPMLSTIAPYIITTPVTEVSVERSFSHLNIILNNKRSRLKGLLLEDILFLRLNQKFIN